MTQIDHLQKTLITQKANEKQDNESASKAKALNKPQRL